MSDLLRTARLVLRPPESADLDPIARLANNWNVARMLGRVPFPYGRAEAEAFLSGVAADADEGVLAITGDGGVLGCIGLHRQAARRHELGYWLGEPYWGQGYAREAAQAILAHAFDALGLPYVSAGHFMDNAVSGRVLQKLGFRYIGEAERDCLARGCKVRSLEMTLSRADWKER